MRRLLPFAFPASLLLLQIVAAQTADLDLWGRLSVGAVLFQAGHLPRTDDFSYSAAGAPWIDHEWLAGVVFYLLLLVGEPALVLFKYAAALLALLLVFVLHGSVYRASLAPAAWTLALASPVLRLGFGTTVRAQVFSIVLFQVFLLVLERVRLGRSGLRALLGLLPVGVVWGNLHGGFVMGILVLGCYAAAEALGGRIGRAAAHAAAALGILVSVALANPYGPGYLGFLLHAWTLDRSHIVEWRPLLEGFPVLSFEAAIAAAAALVAAGLALLGVVGALRARAAVLHERDGWSPIRVPEREPLAATLVLGLSVAMTLLAVRIAPFLVLALASYLPLFVMRSPVARASEGRARALGAAPPAWLHRLLGVWIPAAATAAALAGLALQDRPLLRTLVPHEDSRGESLPKRYPLGAAEFLLASPGSGRLLAPFNKGQFLYWILYPRFRVAMDGRYEEVYGQEQFREVHRFYRRREGEPPEAVVGDAERLGADLVLCPSRWDAKPVLARSDRFDLVYDDGAFALLARTDLPDPLPRVEPRAQRARRPPVTIAAVFAGGGGGRFARYPRPDATGDPADAERLPNRSQ
jgi:hypothetical protein